MNFIGSLHEYSDSELGDLYRESDPPDPGSLDGHFFGNVPAVGSDSLLGTLNRPVSFLSGLGVLPWRGKSFSSDEGTGDNRLLLRRFKTAPFEFREATSVFDGDSCLVLDYSLEENSFLFNYIRDEVRKISENVLLGQMYFKPTSSLVLYFALEKE